MRWARSILTDVVIVLSTAFFALTILLLFVFRVPGANAAAERLVRAWARVNLWASGVTVRLVGEDKLPSARSVVYMSNHQSHYDVLALAGYLPRLPRFVAKQELGRIPIFGQAMQAMGHILIDRSNRAAAIRSLDLAAEKIRSGTSVLMFPEGTRSPDGRLGSFKKGGFMLALKAGVPIVPLSVCGGLAVLPKTTLLPRPGPMEIRVGDPLDPGRWSEERKEDLMEAIREAIARGLSGRLPLPPPRR